MSTFFKFVGDGFGNLSLNLANGIGSNAINSGLDLLSYRNKNDGKIQFLSTPGHQNAYVYIALRTLSQMTYATLNNLYPKYRKHLALKHYKEHLDKQHQQIKEVKKQNNIDNETLLNPQNIKITYRGHQCNEGLLLWINRSAKPLGNGSKTTSPEKNNTITVWTYWDKISSSTDEKHGIHASNGTKIEIPGDRAFLDLGAFVQASSGNNVILTKVQGRDCSRKEMISRNDIKFSVTGNICSNYPDVYPYKEVSDFLSMMRHTGVVSVYNLMFQQFSVNRILITDYSLQKQPRGCKNVQPYSFNCVAVEADKITDEIEDTLAFANQNIEYFAKKKRGKWATMGMNLVRQAGEGLLNTTLQGAESYLTSLTQNI